MKTLLTIALLSLSLHIAGQSDSTYKPKPCTTCGQGSPSKPSRKVSETRFVQAVKSSARTTVSTATTLVEGTLQNRLQTKIIEILR